MSIAIRTRVDLRDVNAGFAEAHRELRAVGRDLVKPMRADQRAHAKAQEGPEAKWPPRASSTVAKMRAQGRRRRPLGRLSTAVTYRATSHAVIAESRAKWSGVHQDGGTVGRGSKIPARPFLWISDRLIDEAIEILQRPILRALGGG